MKDAAALNLTAQTDAVFTLTAEGSASGLGEGNALTADPSSFSVTILPPLTIVQIVGESGDGYVADTDSAYMRLEVTAALDALKFDVADVRAVYNCWNVINRVADYMPVFIRADLDGNGQVDIDDVNAVINVLLSKN